MGCPGEGTYAIALDRSAVCGAGATEAAGIHPDSCVVAGAGYWRHKRRFFGDLRGAGRPLPLPGRRPPCRVAAGRQVRQRPAWRRSQRPASRASAPSQSIEDVTLLDWWNLTTTDGDLPEDVMTNYISPIAPNHFGVRALMGRWLIPSDAPPGETPQPVVVLTYRFWQRYYMGDPNVIGRSIQLVHKPYQIVGV